MKYRLFSMVVLFVLLISFSVCAINFTPEETYNSVVVVYTDAGVGSGFFIKENIIITNAHVVGNSSTVTVNLYDGSVIIGKVKKTDTGKDLALIEVGEKVTPLSVNTQSLTIGQEVYAIGAPKDMPYTMTKGIISALNREIGTNLYIQIDASVNSGNSGGPLVDDNGKVIGVITLKAKGAEGIGFAIAVEDINNFIKGIEAEVPQNSFKTENQENDPSADDGGEKNDKILAKENNGLKIALSLSVIFNIILLILCLQSVLGKKTKSKKSEYDFEIEIEE